MSKHPEKKKMSIAKVLAIAVSLPSAIFGVFALGYILVEKSIISFELALVLIILVTSFMLYLMVRYALKNK